MRNIKRVLLGLAVAGLVVGQGPGASAAPGGPDPSGFEDYHVVTQFDPGEGEAFAESMAPDGQGGMIVSVTTWGAPVDPEEPTGPWTPNSGQLWQVLPNGTTEEFGAEIALGDYAMLTGVEVDDQGRVFVAVFNFAVENQLPGPEVPASGVWHVTEESADQVMTLPQIAMPNGLVEHAGSLYVTDSEAGSIWEGPSDAPSSPITPWFHSRRLEPIDGLGANGIAYGNGALYVASYDQGLILRVPVGMDGAAGKPKVFAKKSSLAAGDGLTFDDCDRLWVTVNGQYDEDSYLVAPPALVVVDAKGHVTTVATPEDSLDYPTDIVFGHDGTAFVSNGSYMNGAPNVVAFTG